MQEVSTPEKITQLILNCAAEHNAVSDRKIDLTRGGESPLYGTQGVLDSLSLVSLLVAVEQAVEDELEVGVTLADERAMSQTRSPFRTIGSLADYVGMLVREHTQHG